MICSFLSLQGWRRFSGPDCRWAQTTCSILLNFLLFLVLTLTSLTPFAAAAEKKAAAAAAKEEKAGMYIIHLEDIFHCCWSLSFLCVSVCDYPLTRLTLSNYLPAAAAKAKEASAKASEERAGECLAISYPFSVSFILSLNQHFLYYNVQLPPPRPRKMLVVSLRAINILIHLYFLSLTKSYILYHPI